MGLRPAGARAARTRDRARRLREAAPATSTSTTPTSTSAARGSSSPRTTRSTGRRRGCWRRSTTSPSERGALIQIVGDPEPELLADLDGTPRRQDADARARRALREGAEPAADQLDDRRLPERGLGDVPSSASRTSSGSGTPSRRRSGSTSPTRSMPGARHIEKLVERAALLNERALRQPPLPRPGHRPHRRPDPRRAVVHGARGDGRRPPARRRTCRPRRSSRARTAVAPRESSARRSRSRSPATSSATSSSASRAAARSRCNASSGADVVREQLRPDEGACMLGEVALVDGDSRVGRSGPHVPEHALRRERELPHRLRRRHPRGDPERHRQERGRARRARLQRLDDPHRLHDRRPRGRGRRDRGRRHGGADPSRRRLAASFPDRRLRLRRRPLRDAASRSPRRTTATARAASGARARPRRRTAARPRARSSSSRARSTCARGRRRAARRRSSAASAARPSSAARRRSARDRRAPRRARRRPGHPAAVAPVRRLRRVLGGDPGRRPAAAPGRAERNARSRAPSSSGFIGGRSRRRLRPGETAAPERESLALLPSGPDAVRMLPVRGTRPSTPRARDLIPLKPPSDGVRSRWSGCRVQGTANSPPSATGQKERSTGAILSTSRAHSSAGERSLHTREVPGSIPGAPINALAATQKRLVTRSRCAGDGAAPSRR